MLIGHNLRIANAKDRKDRRVTGLNQGSNSLDKIVRNAKLVLPRRCVGPILSKVPFVVISACRAIL
jgi:hypothetical protein